MADDAVEVKMDALRRRLVKAVKVDGIVTYKELSLALDQNPTFVQQFVTKRSPKRLYEEQVGIITRILDTRELTRKPVVSPPENILTPEVEKEYLTRLRNADPEVRKSVLTLLGLRF